MVNNIINKAEKPVLTKIENVFILRNEEICNLIKTTNTLRAFIGDIIISLQGEHNDYMLNQYREMGTSIFCSYINTLLRYSIVEMSELYGVSVSLNHNMEYIHPQNLIQYIHTSDSYLILSNLINSIVVNCCLGEDKSTISDDFVIRGDMQRGIVESFNSVGDYVNKTFDIYDDIRLNIQTVLLPELKYYASVLYETLGY